MSAKTFGAQTTVNNRQRSHKLMWDNFYKFAQCVGKLVWKDLAERFLGIFFNIFVYCQNLNVKMICFVRNCTNLIRKRLTGFYSNGCVHYYFLNINKTLFLSPIKYRFLELFYLNQQHWTKVSKGFCYHLNPYLSTFVITYTKEIKINKH